MPSLQRLRLRLLLPLALDQRYPFVLIIKHHLERLKQVATDVAEGVRRVERADGSGGEGGFDILQTMAAEFKVLERSLLGFDVAAHATGNGILCLAAFEELELFDDG